MARNVIALTGSCDYTVPAGKVAKIIIRSLSFSGTNCTADIAVGPYKFSYNSGNSQETYFGTEYTQRVHATNDGAPIVNIGGNSNYLIVSRRDPTDRLDLETGFIIREHYLVNGESVHIGGSVQSETSIIVFEEDV